MKIDFMTSKHNTVLVYLDQPVDALVEAVPQVAAFRRRVKGLDGVPNVSRRRLPCPATKTPSTSDNKRLERRHSRLKA